MSREAREGCQSGHREKYFMTLFLKKSEQEARAQGWAAGPWALGILQQWGAGRGCPVAAGQEIWQERIRQNEGRPD